MARRQRCDRSLANWPTYLTPTFIASIVQLVWLEKMASTADVSEMAYYPTTTAASAETLFNSSERDLVEPVEDLCMSMARQAAAFSEYSMADTVAFIVYGWLIPLVTLPGLFAAIICVIVFTRKQVSLVKVNFTHVRLQETRLRNIRLQTFAMHKHFCPSQISKLDSFEKRKCGKYRVFMAIPVTKTVFGLHTVETNLKNCSSACRA